MTISELMIIIGFFFTIVVQTWLVVKYIIDRMDSKMNIERAERLRSEASFLQELKDYGTTHVRRDDFHRHVDNVEKQIGNLMVLITNMSTGVNSRLDNIVNMMTKVRGVEHDN